MKYEQLLSYPSVDHAATDRLLSEELEKSDLKLVVLDDDPTGVQTVHDVSVFTDWTVESIREGFRNPDRLFYILTNSRGLTEPETTELHRSIGERVLAVSKETGRDFVILNRSDSTLRGHFPLETEVLKDTLEQGGYHIDGEIICPFFLEGGRYTLDDIHYVKQGDILVPAGETEFAKDRTFGYQSSDLKDYVEEKTGGRFPASGVVSVSLKSLRSPDPDTVEQQLLSVTGFGKVVVNALSYEDLKVFTAALYRAMASGKRFLFRTAAALVRVMGGVGPIPYLTRKDMIHDETENGGVIVVGSHTQKTTAQLGKLLTLENVVPVEFRSDLVLSGDEAFYGEVERCVKEEERIIRSGKTAVCFTARKLLEVPGDDGEKALRRSVKISDGVQRLVGSLNVRPSFVVAKGGITSSDVGTKALKVKQARVLGQILPSIPVWKTGEESLFPGVPYIIFPGNTGDEDSLRKAAEILMNKP